MDKTFFKVWRNNINICWLIVGLYVGQNLLAVYLTTVSQQIANKGPTVSNRLAESRTTDGRQVFWELFSTITFY